MWIPGPSSENVAGVGELSLAFFFKSCLSVIIESEWGCSLLQNVGFSVWGLLSGQSTDSVAVAHLLASWNVGSSCIRDRMHRSLRWQRVVIHCTTREVQLVLLRPLKSRGGIECDEEGCSLWHWPRWIGPNSLLQPTETCLILDGSGHHSFKRTESQMWFCVVTPAFSFALCAQVILCYFKPRHTDSLWQTLSPLYPSRVMFFYCDLCWTLVLLRKWFWVLNSMKIFFSSRHELESSSFVKKKIFFSFQFLYSPTLCSTI